jgi:hypothetical protein
VESHREGVPEVDASGQAWLRRPFARLFDLISAQYGWTDDQILDTTFQRLRQIHEVIMERQNEEHRQTLRDRTEEIRLLGQIFAAPYGDKLMAQAAQVSLLPPEPVKPGQLPKERPLPDTDTLMRMFSGARP